MYMRTYPIWDEVYAIGVVVMMMDCPIYVKVMLMLKDLRN